MIGDDSFVVNISNFNAWIFKARKFISSDEILDILEILWVTLWKCSKDGVECVFSVNNNLRCFFCFKVARCVS